MGRSATRGTPLVARTETQKLSPPVKANDALFAVVAVPTSVGYGASFNGLAALLCMLSSCAPGITVVNIDNGFGAAMAASRICRVH